MGVGTVGTMGTVGTVNTVDTVDMVSKVDTVDTVDMVAVGTVGMVVVDTAMNTEDQGLSILNSFKSFLPEGRKIFSVSIGLCDRES
jgi:hypothetical protein